MLKTLKLNTALAFIFSLLTYFHFKHYLSFALRFTLEFISSGGYKTVMNLQSTYLRLFVMFCFWFTMAILVYSAFWLFRVLYTDVYNFLVIKVVYKNEEGNIEDLIKREMRFFSRLGIHFLGIIPFILILVLIYYSFFILENLWFVVLRFNFSTSFGLLRYKIEYKFVIFYFIVLLYWYLVFSFTTIAIKGIREFFIAEEIAEEHNL